MPVRLGEAVLTEQLIQFCLAKPLLHLSVPISLPDFLTGTKFWFPDRRRLTRETNPLLNPATSSYDMLGDHVRVRESRAE